MGGKDGDKSRKRLNSPRQESEYSLPLRNLNFLNKLMIKHMSQYNKVIDLLKLAADRTAW
jgi:hypothetical protein